MSKVRSTRIAGKRVKVHLDPIAGYSIDYKGGEGELYVDPRQSDEEASYTAFHEFIHARFPNLTESQVKQIEREWRGFYGRLFTVKKKDGAW